MDRVQTKRISKDRSQMPPRDGESLASKRLFSSLAPQVMIAIGGWNEGSTKYSGMAKDKKKRQKFVNSTIDFLQKHNFDGIFKIIDANLPKKGGLPPPPSSSSSSSSGLDLDWEYPAKRGGSPQDKKNFILLVKELKEVNVSKINFFKTQFNRLQLAGVHPSQISPHCSHRSRQGHH